MELPGKVVDDGATTNLPQVTADELPVLIAGTAAILRELGAHCEAAVQPNMPGSERTRRRCVDADPEGQQAYLVGLVQLFSPALPIAKLEGARPDHPVLG